MFEPGTLLDALLGEIEADDFRYEKDASRAVDAARRDRKVAARVQVMGPVEGALRVSPLADWGEARTPVALRRGRDFDCERGALTVHHRSHGDNANVCAAFWWSRTTLWRDAEGGIAAQNTGGGLCIGLGAVYIGSAEWARFSQVRVKRTRPPATP